MFSSAQSDAANADKDQAVSITTEDSSRSDAPSAIVSLLAAASSSSAGLFSAASTSQQAAMTDIITQPIPFFPRRGNIADIKDKEKCRLMTDNDLQAAKLGVQIVALGRDAVEDDRFSRHVLPMPWNMIRKGDELYALYFRIGAGKYGRVWAVQNQKTGKWRASKIVPVAPQTNLSPTQRIAATARIASATAEYNNNVLLGHTYAHEPIGKRLSSTKNPQKSPLLKRDKNEIQWSFLMDMADGLPVDTITTENPKIALKLPSIFWIQMILDAIQALKELHQHQKQPLLHCDLKPDNFIYDFITNVMSIVDLGMALPLTRGSTQQTNLRGSFTHWTANIRILWRDALIKKASGGNLELSIPVSEQTDIHALLITIAEILNLFEPPIDPKKEEFLNFLKTFDPKKNYVVDKSSPLFASNDRINDPAMREDILNYLNQSTNGSEPTPTLDSISAFFNAMKQRCQLAGDKIKVGILNIQDYLQYDEATRNNLIEALKAMHKVQLVDTSHHTDFEAMKIKWELENAGIHIVIDKVHRGPGIEKLIAKTQQDCNAGKLKDCYEFHDAKTLLADYRPPTEVRLLSRSFATTSLHAT